ncbi:NAD-dependent epimerase/dehydratase family protein [Arthrobacter sp. Br18]|uniref:NAD-dependent epimerase/dehydratase family protein n=1 Tax=Arthrobacter sp. Br18 TaxID=1312954 RepID=UPI0004B2916E|nr:NAD-dependent epimerase/dehydratase family protein [Arthrobacter sp. Br18]
MRIAVIGATGNVGTAVLRRLHRAAVERKETGGEPLSVTGVARRAPDPAVAPYRGVDWHMLDVGTDSGRAQLTAVLEGVDAVVHLAWAIQPNRNEAAMYRTNVTGTSNVLRAAADAKVQQVVCASSVAAYSAADKDSRTDESWPTAGIPTSHYSRQKAEQERLLDRFEADHPERTVARLRPGLIFQPEAGSEIGRYFLGPFIPKLVLGRIPLPLIPLPAQLIFQAVHADDVADAYWRVVKQRASGPFNIAAEPEITPARLAAVLGARRVLNIPVPLLRAVVAVSWAAGLQRTDPGWIDLAALVPVMDTSRARTLLGWSAEHSSRDTLTAVLDGLRTGNGLKGSPTLYPRRVAPGRRSSAQQ